MANRTATGVFMIGVGGLILWSGITNAGVVASVQSLIHGVAPTPGTPQVPFFKGGGNGATQTAYSPGTTSTAGGNNSVASAAVKYVGTPYIWGGHDPSGWDCYGFLTYVLHHDLGYNLPNNTHSGYLEFLAWGGASTVDSSQIQAGDLILWPTHSGIAVSGTEMISAENPSKGTRIDTFANGGPLAPEPMTVKRVGQIAYA